MEKIFLSFFPFPHMINDVSYDGLLIKKPDRCNTCVSLECRKTAEEKIKLCSYGYNYLLIDKKLLVFGLIIKDYSTTSQAREKVIRKSNKKNILLLEDIQAVIKIIKEKDKLAVNEIGKEKEKIIEVYKKENLYKKDLLDLIMPELTKAFSSLHDYKQFVTQVIQNVNVILETRYPGISIEEKLNAALHPEKAIYWASRLMEEKLNTSLFIKYQDKITDRNEYTKFSLHGLVIKYLRIYQMAFDERNIKVNVKGRSDGKLLGNPKAIGVIPHTFIDNALKYAPEGSEVLIEFVEDVNEVKLIVSSYGPKIEKNERERIFEPFTRGAAAVKLKEEGTGFGLYITRVIALQIGTDIKVEQAGNSKSGYYLTTFSVTFQREE